MFHKCNNYCLGCKAEQGDKHRVCQFGYRKEATQNKGDTPGKDLIDKPVIVKDH